MTTDSSVLQDIELLEKRIITAMITADVKALNELIHEDLQFVVPNGQTITKKEDLATYESGAMKISNITATKQKISIVENTAIVITEVLMTGKYTTISIDGTYTVMRVWKKANNRWSIIAGSCCFLMN